MTNIATTDLGLTDISADASAAGDSCCGAGGCATDATPVDSAAQAGDAASETTTELHVAGMTCGHCITSVTRELSAIDGVTGVDVALVAGGISTVTVQSAAPLATDAVAAAIDEAGYELA